MEKARVAALVRVLNEESECVRCGLTYRERDNAGTWQCAYHPEHAQGMECGSGTVTHTCCGRAPDAGRHAGRGCVPCDHVCWPRVYGDPCKHPLAAYATGARPRTRSAQEATLRLPGALAHALYDERTRAAPGWQHDSATDTYLVGRVGAAAPARRE